MKTFHSNFGLLFCLGGVVVWKNGFLSIFISVSMCWRLKPQNIIFNWYLSYKFDSGNTSLFTSQFSVRGNTEIFTLNWTLMIFTYGLRFPFTSTFGSINITDNNRNKISAKKLYVELKAYFWQNSKWIYWNVFSGVFNHSKDLIFKIDSKPGSKPSNITLQTLWRFMFEIDVGWFAESKIISFQQKNVWNNVWASS